MPQRCAAVGCPKNSSKHPEMGFFRFPAASLHGARRAKWIEALRRVNADGSPWAPTANSRVCGGHFIQGEPSRFPDHPDYVPSVFKRKSTGEDGAVDTFERVQSGRGSKPATSLHSHGIEEASAAAPVQVVVDSTATNSHHAPDVESAHLSSPATYDSVRSYEMLDEGNSSHDAPDVESVHLSSPATYDSVRSYEMLDEGNSSHDAPDVESVHLSSTTKDDSFMSDEMFHDSCSSQHAPDIESVHISTSAKDDSVKSCKMLDQGCQADDNTFGRIQQLEALLAAEKVSDRAIVQQCGVLDALEPGDAVMVDKGFKIDDLLPLGVSRYMPPFRIPGVAQMSRADVNQTKRVASARVHIERVIRRIKEFHILDRAFPINMLDLADAVFATCAFLSNFRTALIRHERNDAESDFE
ncbi:hypothetical protein MTO96_037126 [Rhipicephalus appendiculatus]